MRSLCLCTLPYTDKLRTGVGLCVVFVRCNCAGRKNTTPCLVHTQAVVLLLILGNASGWDQPNFDDSKWSAALLMHPRVGVLSSSVYPPIAVLDQLTAVNITQVCALYYIAIVTFCLSYYCFFSVQPAPGVWVYDFGQEIAGFSTLTVSGTAGTKGIP